MTMISLPPSTSYVRNYSRVRNRSRLPIETTFLLISSVFGSLFLLITPPFQVADESRHFARAYQLSERALHSVGLISVLDALPSSLVRAIEQTNYLRSGKDSKFTTDQLTSLISKPLEPNQRADFSETASYTFVSYLPQILAIIPLRLAEVNSVTTLYAARLAALLFWMLLTYWAIRLIPIAKPLLFLIALLPMTLFQAASLSADSMTFALSFLLIGVYLRLAYRSVRVSTGQLMGTIGLGAALTAAKFVYAPLIGLHFLIPLSKFRSSTTHRVTFLVTIGGCLLILAAPFNSLFIQATASLTTESTTTAAGLTPYPQLNFFLADPLNILRTAIATFLRFGRSYMDGFVGIMGWYGASLPSYLYVATVVMLWLTALTTSDKFEVTAGQKIGLLLIAVIITAAVCIGISTDVRENPLPTIQMRGIQGRYFIPLALLIGLLIANQWPIFRQYQRFVRRATVPFILFLLANACYYLLIHYYF